MTRRSFRFYEATNCKKIFCKNRINNIIFNRFYNLRFKKTDEKFYRRKNLAVQFPHFIFLFLEHNLRKTYCFKSSLLPNNEDLLNPIIVIRKPVK
ncbi:hypothetical protein EFY79_20985 [Hanamia caeni]|uniref:Uncharacterized protein n=1 Tax=Hanamia caeni TaxID=2294116 RepID=A0A3M9N3F0_9BACT|nr:hypothetical protein EFY79_20985 [Hanamia caeni]